MQLFIQLLHVIMVKKLSLFTVALFTIVAFTTHAQTTVTVGSGVGSGTASPIATWYNTSATESIYTAAEIGTTGYITTLGYQKMGGNSTVAPAVKIYIKATATASLSDAVYTIGNAFIDYVLVYDGTLPNNGTGWMQVSLQTPFAYTNGSQNLSILTVGTTCIESGRPQYSYTSTVNRMSAYYNDGSIACGGNAPFTSAVTMRPVWERPNIRFTITTELGTGIANTPANNIIVFNNTGKLTVQSQNAALKNVSVYDVQGRELLSMNANGHELTINGLNTAGQLLIIKATDVNNRTTTLKTLY